MKAEEVLDWIVAIFVLLFILVPMVSSIFFRKKIPHPQKKAPKQHTHLKKEKNAIQQKKY